MKNKNQPVYPHIYLDDDKKVVCHGLTKLEHISAMCLQGLLSDAKIIKASNDVEQVVAVAIQCANELLEQLEKQK